MNLGTAGITIVVVTTLFLTVWGFTLGQNDIIDTQFSHASRVDEQITKLQEEFTFLRMRVDELERSADYGERQ